MDLGRGQPTRKNRDARLHSPFDQPFVKMRANQELGTDVNRAARSLD